MGKRGAGQGRGGKKEGKKEGFLGLVCRETSYSWFT